jgi:CBS domain-containing protein
MTVQCILDAKGKGAAHIAPDATIAQVVQSLESQNVDALVVSCDASSVDGIISEHDVVLGLKKFGSDLLDKLVRDLMTAKVITCTPGERLESIAAVMVSKHVRHLPVVTHNKLVGIVSIRDASFASGCSTVRRRRYAALYPGALMRRTPRAASQVDSASLRRQLKALTRAAACGSQAT